MEEVSMVARTQKAQPALLSRKHAVAFIVLLGLVSMFGDMTYEGARSINGTYLAALGSGDKL
jgi:hypothetical protein